ncbi:hypothetical protein QMZ93_07240 [Pantoea stewartii subsp. indologenes]|uniref:hypothetical protein n=1 Tax=Pantoea stewartii TaxID=66269 RepID=UPI0024DF98AA|nr:hypothetical protein [Pantoea stewartii]MDK2633136.1 hypothetical protein [Pantoea stewartii subsp. indologenes]
MSEISKLIAEIKSEGILRAGNKLEQLYSLAEQMETDYAALQQKLDAMAAESAALKQVAMDYADLADSRLSEMTANCESDCLRECYEFTNKIPATDTYLNSVRADAVIEASAYLADIAQGKSPHTAELIKSCGRTVFAYGESLRSGTHDTADKAG